MRVLRVCHRYGGVSELPFARGGIRAFMYEGRQTGRHM